MNPETILTHDEHCPYEGAAVPPIFQNSLFTFESWEAIDEAFSNRLEKFIYTRVKNPTVKEAQKKIAAIAGGSADWSADDQALIDLADLDPEAIEWARKQTPQTAKALRLDDPFEINQGHIERLAAGFVCGQPGQLVVPYLQVAG